MGCRGPDSGLVRAPRTSGTPGLKLDGPRWVLAGSYAGLDGVRAEPFAEIGLKLRRLWAVAPSPA
jgi:hypothetical protein